MSDSKSPKLAWIESPLEGHFIERLNRFAGMVDIEGSATKVYLPNSGRLEELLQPGARVMLEKRRQQGKTLHDLLLIETTEFGSQQPLWAALDSRLPPQLMRWVIRQGLLEDFPAQAEIKMEPTVSAGRLDLLLTHMGQRHYIETKSVNLIDRTGMARFPDAPTARGRRHLEELIRLRQLGYRSSLVFVIVRHDALGMAPFNERDPAFGQALTAAFQAGVELLALKFKVGASIQYAGKIPLELEPEPFPGYWPRLLP